MDVERIKKYLQNYLDSVVTSRIKQDLPEGEDVKFIVHDILKGSYNPPIIHVFIDTEPESFVSRGWDVPHRKHKSVEKDIEDFFKLLSIDNKIKVHWNKRPFFRKGKQRNDFSI